jgi:calpain-15
MRPSDVVAFGKGYSQQPWTVLNSPKPSDICQGVLGNCWFLSALAVIVELPALLEHILVTRDYCPQGVYQIRLCKDGDWITVVVDDLFPCDQYGRLIYSQTKRKQLWVPLIEKAFAKINGCYQALTAGRCIEGLATLTGAPCDSIQLSGSPKTEDDKNLIWAKLLSSRECGFLMGASCGGGNMKVDDKVYEKLGLIARHAYSILDVQIVEGNRLMRLRNPWGRFSWKGDWSDTSDTWQRLSSSCRDQLKPLGQEEGVFWMSLDDVIRYFDVVDICKYRSDWMESRQKTVLPSNAVAPIRVIQIEVFEATEFEFGLFQQGARGKERSKRNPVDLCVCVYKCHGTGTSAGGTVGSLVSNSKRLVESYVGTNCFLEPGVYLVFTLAFNHWSAGLPSNVNAILSIYSSKAHLVEPVTLSQTALADAVIQLAVAKGERHEGREGMTTYYLSRNWAGFIVVIENRHPDCALHVQCDCSASTNVVSTRCALKTVDAIPSLHRQVIMVLSQLERTSGYSLSHRLTHRCQAVGLGLGDWAPGANHVPALTAELYGLHAPRPL